MPFAMQWRCSVGQMNAVPILVDVGLSRADEPNADIFSLCRRLTRRPPLQEVANAQVWAGGPLPPAVLYDKRLETTTSMNMVLA